MDMIITNSTPDLYYFEQLIAFLMSIKINSPKHINMVKVFLANYPKDLEEKLKKTFREVSFENNNLSMVDSRGFGTIIDRAFRVKECLKKYKENVLWLDTDIIIRGDLTKLLEVDSKQLKILYRKKNNERNRINAGVFNIGYSDITYNFISEWYERIKVNKKWGDGQLEFWRTFVKYLENIKLIDITLKYNSVGNFNDEYIVWHCKKGHFDRSKYQIEYKKYLQIARDYIEGIEMDKDYIILNSEITKKILESQTQIDLNKIMTKRHIPIVNIVSKYSDKSLPLLDVGAREGNLLKLLFKNDFKDLYGIDISNEAITKLKERGFNCSIEDAQKFDLKKKFGTIIISHVLEHCPEPAKVLNNIYDHLLDNGLLYVEVPRQPKIDMPTKAGHYLHYDELNDLISLFDINKWKLLYCLYERGEKKGVIKTLFKKLS